MLQNYTILKVQIHPGWQSVLADEFNKPYFSQLVDFVKREYRANVCFPQGSAIFNAFNLCPFEATRVVIIGQDPYHGPGQAHGLCFSVPEGVPHPPSLQNIFKELQQSVGLPNPVSGDLTRWATQGVLLLNATLTVRSGQAGSHQNKGWETFTDAVISKLSEQKEHLVFLLWGGYAKKKAALVDGKKHLILSCGHPSPLSANKGYWFGNNHFNKTNEYLNLHQFSPIKW